MSHKKFISSTMRKQLLCFVLTFQLEPVYRGVQLKKDYARAQYKTFPAVEEILIIVSDTLIFLDILIPLTNKQTEQ